MDKPITATDVALSFKSERAKKNEAEIQDMVWKELGLDKWLEGILEKVKDLK